MKHTSKIWTLPRPGTIGAFGAALVLVGLHAPAKLSGIAPLSLGPSSAWADDDDKANATDAMFARDATEEAFQAAVVRARGAGVLPQVVLEARFVHLARAENTEGLASLLPEAEKLFTTPDLDASKIFNSPDDAEGILDSLRALDAGGKGDAPGYEKWIKEAFWKAPSWAETFASWTTVFQRDQRMAVLTLPMDVPIGTYDGKKVTLADLTQGKKAVLIDFWASWCGPCMANMPELKSRGAKLPGMGVAVVALNTEGDPKIATRVRTEQGMTIPWLVEPTNQPYTKPLEVDTIPRAILLSPDGKVLFNGHPADAALKTALAKLGVKL